MGHTLILKVFISLENCCLQNHRFLLADSSVVNLSLSTVSQEMLKLSLMSHSCSSLWSEQGWVAAVVVSAVQMFFILLCSSWLESWFLLVPAGESLGAAVD